MTLDSLTRASAEQKHVALKSSLVQTRSEFRDRFKLETDLFRTLPVSPHAVPLSPISHPGIAKEKAAAPVLLGEDLVRTERLAQCCKRVRVWKRQTTNPLLPYKQQQLAKSSGSASGGGGGSTSLSKGTTSATDHRMHLSLLMAMIVDMYEQKMTAEVGSATVLLPTCGGTSESFPEFAIKYISARASSRRTAVDQIHGMVAMLLQPSAHARVRAFASLCGVDDRYNPPEKLRAFLHMVESVHRLKVSATASASSASAGAAAVVIAVKPEDAASLSEVVFYNLGVTLSVAHRVIAELFDEEYYWNFRFWHSHFQELKLNYAWPAAAKLELEEKALGLAAVTRNAALNAARKIDTDAFLELLLETWTTRARSLAGLLDAATDEEEHRSAAAVVHKQALQDARGHIAPPSEAERQLFDQLVDECWNAEVPWWTNAKIQRRVDAACRGSRSLDEVASLYRKHVAELDEAKKVWHWAEWPWDPEWEWGLLVATGDRSAAQKAGAASGCPHMGSAALGMPRGATDSAVIAALAHR